jgi:hypothetical protein
MADINEIRVIKSLPSHKEYIPREAQRGDLVVMSVDPLEKMKSALDKKLFLIKRLREKIIFRLNAAEE